MSASAARLLSGPLPPPQPPAISAPKKLSLKVAIRDERKQQAPKSMSVSRRDMLSFTAQTLTAVTFWSAAPAEARMSRSEIKKKLLEKLEQLREKAGFSKPKERDEESDPGKEKRLQSSSPSSNPLDNPVKAMVESVFP